MAHIETGTVLSANAAKTVVVLVEKTYRHPLYKKVVKKSKKYMAHVEDGAYAVGDKVEIKETRPMSKNKSFVVVRKVA